MLITLGLWTVSAGASRGDDGNLFFYEKTIASMAQCHDVYTAHTPDWKSRENFVRRALPGGRELISQCVPDGVSELYCDPGSKLSVVSILVDETVPACHDITPRLTVREVEALHLLRPDKPKQDAAMRPDDLGVVTAR
ncbi:hypothetical protein ACQQ2Q_02190 [Agrobacterium sp. ES01]|uniref:hypothetical protein n=1 Tax=Agrobacterium sp. ES01 TaxID=3420714 RepID=UPI003D14F38B